VCVASRGLVFFTHLRKRTAARHIARAVAQPDDIDAFACQGLVLVERIPHCDTSKAANGSVGLAACAGCVDSRGAFEFPGACLLVPVCPFAEGRTLRSAPQPLLCLGAAA